MATTGQFWFLTLGTAADARIDYTNIDASALSGGSNTNGAVTLFQDNTSGHLGSNYPEDLQVDWAAGLYYVITSDPTLGSGAQVLMGHLNSAAAPTVVWTPSSIGGDNTNDIVNTIQLDPYTHHLYIGYTEASGSQPNKEGLLNYTYNTSTGAITAVAANGGFLVTETQAGVTASGAGATNTFDARDLAFDHTHNFLFFVQHTDTDGFESNEVYRIDLSNPTAAATKLVVQSQFPWDNNGSNVYAGNNGAINSVEVDPSTGLVYFDTESVHASPAADYTATTNKIYYISENASSGTATAVTITGLPGGNHFYPGKMTLDLDTRQIYVMSEETDTGGVVVKDDVIYVLQLDATGHSAALVNTISPSPAFETDASNFAGMSFDELAQLGTLTATLTHPAEQDVNVTLLTATPTITDSNGDHLNNATVQITSGTFSSNENTTADDHLTIVSGHRTGTATSGTISDAGFNISYSYDSATEKLTLSGYDTLADYQTALTYVQYSTTGDNPTNYGNNASRTVTWQVNDGAVGNPSGTVDGTTTNVRTTTINIDAKNDAPVNNGGAQTGNEDTTFTLTGLSITDVDADPANQNLTMAFSVAHGTLTFNTGVAGGIVVGDITSGANGSNSVTITATQNKINATLGNATGLQYHGDLNFNTGFASEALHIVTNDNSHTDSTAFPGAQTDTDNLTITVNAVNDAPNLQPDTTSAVGYTENAAATALFASENVDTPLADVDQSANYSGGSIDLNITAGAVSGDRISLTGATFHISGGNVQDSGNVNIGAISGNGTSHVTVSALTSAATPSVVDALIQSFGFDSTSDNPGAGDRTITLTFNDGGNTGSGGALTDAVTQTEHVTPVNDAPVATTPVAHYTATEQVNLNLHGTGLSVSDVDGNSGNETVTLSVGEGTITLSAGNSGVGSISGSGTSSLTFSGTLTQLNALLSGSSTGTLIYNDPSDTPVASTTLTLLIHDNGNTGTGGDLSSSSNSTIDITAVNDAPVAVLGTDPYAATENVALDIKSTSMSVSDVDALGAVEVATLSVTQGVLNITAGTSGVTVGTNGTSSVTLTGTLAQINDLLNTNGTSTVSYTETNDNPSATVTLTLQINDQGNTGTGGAHTGTDTSTINVTAVNDAPVATTPVAHYTATEQVNLNLHGTGLSVSDVDGNSGSETVTLSVGEGTITLSAGNSGVGSISGSGTSSLTFSGTLTQLNALLSGSSTGTLIYNDPSDTPVASTTLTLLIHDNGNTGTGGDHSSSSNSTIDITAVNDAPAAVMTTDPYAATEQTTLVLKGTGQSVSDVDALGASETVTLSVGEGALTVTEGDSGVTVITGNGTSSVQVSGTIAQLNALLAAGGTSNLTYIDNTDNPSASTTLTLHVDDGGATGTGGAQTGQDTSTINITAVNDAPLATITPTEYDGSPNVAINLKNNGLSVSDVDGNAGSETVTLSTTPDGTLTVTTGGSGALVSNSGTSSVTITGTIAQINALLNTDGTSTVSFVDAAGGTKTLTLLIHDNGNTGGGDLFASDTANIVLDNPPVVDLNGPTLGTGVTLTYTENAAGTVIAPAGVTTDIDSTDFNTGSLTVHFSAGGSIADQLSIITDSTIQLNGSTVQYDADGAGGNPAVDIGTVSGGSNGADLVIAFNTTDATPTSVSTLIEHIGYANSSDNPSASRTATFTVNDGDGASGSADATINVTAVNDGPAATITPTSYSATEQTSLSLKNNGLAVSDVDGNAGSETVTLSVTEGTLTVTAGGSGAIVNNSGTASVTISGTLAQINALLNTDGTSTVSYIDNTDDPSASATLTLLVHDNGNTGGGDLSSSDTATINITAVNDPPVLNNVPATADYTENAAPVTFSAVFPNQIFVTDPDPVPHGAPGGNGLALSATVKISSGFVAGDQLLVFDTTTATSATSGFYTGINIQWNYDATTHILTLFSADPPTNSGDTLIDFAHVLDNIQFASTSDDPANGGVNTTRTLQWQIQDAGGTANGGNDLSAIYTTTLTIHPVNDAPAATITPTSYTATEQLTLSLKNNGVAVSDVDGGAGSETVTLSVGEGVLNVTAGGSGAGVAGSGTNSVTLTGTAAQINALLNTDGTSTVGYIDNTDTPGASTTLTLLIHDNGNTGTGGDLSSSDSATINITAVDDVPVLNGLTDTPAFVENGSSVRLDANQNATVSDPELDVSPNKYQGASLTLMRHGGPNADDSFVASGTLDVTDVSGTGENVSLDGGATFIGTFVDNGDGSIKFTFNSSATATNIHDVMAQIFYSNASDNPPAAVPVDFIFDDGNGEPGGQPQGTGSGITTATVNVQVTQVDDPPALLNVAVAATYSISSAGAILSNGLQVFDPDAAPPSPNPGLVSATITITAGFLAGDQLFVNLPTSGGFFQTDDDADPSTPAVTTNISVTSNSGGQLVLGGLDSVLHYQEVLDAVSYSSSAADPTNAGADQTRTINWKVSDGVLDNQAPSVPHYPETTLGFNTPPSVDLDGSTAGNNYITTFTENGAPIPIANANVSVTDTDDASISSATIVLTNAKAGDALSIAGTLPDGISSSIDTSVAGQITVTLSDSGTFTDYQTALGQIRFVNSSDAPDTTDRDITVEVANSGTSNTAHATVHIVAVNDAPVNAVPGPQSVNEDTNLAIAGLAVSDVDAGAGTVSTTLSVAHGTLTVASAGGAVVGGSGTNSVTLTGTLAQINTTLSAAGNVVYKGAANFNGGDVLNVVTNDGGNTGGGGAQSDTDTVAITVNAVNDPPVFAHFGATHTSATEQTVTVLNGAATVSDVELDAANGGAGNYAGASLIIGRAGSPAPNPEDTFFFGGPGAAFTVDTVNHALLAGGQQFATYNIPSSGSLAGTIAVNFNSLNTAATTALVNNVLQHIIYENLSDTPPASVTMHYTFNDGNAGAQGSGGNGSDTANRVVDITPVNDAPVAQNGTASGNEDAVITGTLVATDVDSPSLTFSRVAQTAHGSVTVNGDGTFSYTPNANFNGTDSFTFKANDGLLDSNAATVSITVNPVNDAPVAQNGTASGNEDTVITGTLVATDVDNPSLTFSRVAQTAHGSVTVNGDGTFSYTPNANFNGTDSFTFKANDGFLDSNTATESITVNAVNDAPVVSGVVTLPQIAESSGAHLITQAQLLANASDVDGPSLTAINLAIAAGVGTLVDNHNGTWSFTPADTDSTGVSFSYQVTDGIAAPVADSANLDIGQPHWMASSDLGVHPAGSSPSAIGDYVQDGTSDILWENPATLGVDVWKISNGQWAGSVLITAHPAGYQLAPSGDFNGDGISDVLWYNSTTGHVDLWKIFNGQWGGSVTVGTHPLGWQPAASGDFNHDGVSDILWYNPTTGGAEIWKVSNSGQWAGTSDLGSHPAGWQPAGAGDFNGDGTSDVLWYNPTTNDAEIWKISNGQWAGSVDLGSHPAGWTPAGIGDFNGDGTSDVLWFNAATNDAEVWLISNGHWAGSVDLGTHPAGWTPAGVGDFNHDGTSDILWRETSTNHTEIWLLANH